MTLNFWALAAVVTTFSGIGIVLLLRQSRAPVARSAYAAPLPWHLVLILLLLALLGWRYATLVQELLLRPLYAWDAWMNWVPKAIVWFQHGELVDFIYPEHWLQHTGPEVYTLGNRQATPYPETVPLIQLWMMLGIGTWDHSVILLPWLLVPVALGLALFGHLRQAGVPQYLAVIACYLLLSLPYLNVHAVLAGYADIWLAASFCLGVGALYAWRQSRQWGYAVLFALMALLSSQLKNPGVVLALILVLAGIRAFLNLRLRVELALAVLLAGLLGVVLAYGFSVELPWLGRIALDADAIEVGRLGHFELQYHPVGTTFLETFFVMTNWHLLWFLLVPFACYCVFQATQSRLPVTEFLPAFAALVFVVFVFVFSRHYVAAENFVTLNRALLYVVPAMTFSFFLCFSSRESVRSPGI